MTDHFFISSRLTKVQQSEEELSRIEGFIGSLRDRQKAQDDFFNYCKQWKIAPWVYTQLERNDLLKFLTEQTQQSFRDVHRLVQTDNENRNAEAVRFLTEFKKANIEVAILKGNLLLHTVYHDTGYKRMNDFDILIHPKDWPAVQDIYMRLGYIPLGFGWSGEKQKPAKFSHAGMSFISPNFKCIIGTQWGLKSPTTDYRVDIAEAWQTSRDFDFNGVPVKQLSPEYNLLHLVLHMGIYKCGIRDCMDVYNLLLTETDLDEAKLIALFKKSNASDKAFFTLRLCDYCSDAVPFSLLNNIAPKANSYHGQRIKSRLQLTLKTGDMQASYQDYFQDIEKDVIYFNLFPKFHQKVFFYYKIHKQIVWPEKEIALKLSDKNYKPSISNVVTARLKAPFLVLALISEEIGSKITGLLLLKISIDLILSLKNYVVKKESYFDYLKKRGINPKDIERAVKNIQ